MEQQPILSIDQFRNEAKADGYEKKPKINDSFNTEVKVSEDNKRSLVFTISTASVDRMGDTIAVDGWKLDKFKQNPVVLWSHLSSDPPIAKAPKIWIEAGKLKAEAVFVPQDMPVVGELAECNFRMYKEGFLNATSVGFKPIKYAFSKDPARQFGIDFVEQELLEFSCCSVPANPDALIEARAAGININSFIDAYAEQIIKTSEGEKLSTILEKLAAKCGKAVVSKARMETVNRAMEKLRRKSKLERYSRELEVVRLKSF